ncbi:MAG: branched-chain amino acid transaminase [Chloroflexi bacterium]|nr:branched-chain amino acid transaminase [Chloroflexota bacterium]
MADDRPAPPGAALHEKTATQGQTAAPPPTPAYLWHNGRLVPWQDATVHITQIGWTAISAVFEGIRGYWSNERQDLYLFRLDEHLKRLARSMKLMRMAPAVSAADLTSAMLDLLRANEFREDVYVQPLVYFAGGVPGYRAAYTQPTEVLITARPAPSALKTGRASHCCISSWVRLADHVMPPRAKALANYQNSRLVSTEARINGYDGGIMLNERGKVAEGAYACIFLVRDGVAVTPPATAGILESITRASLLEALPQVLGVPVEVREVDRTELYLADEVFLCGTLAEIDPVVSVDRYSVGTGEPGTVTRRLEDLYHGLVRGTDPRYPAWRIPVYHDA